MCVGRRRGLRVWLIVAHWSGCGRQWGCLMWRLETGCGLQWGIGVVSEAEAPLEVGDPWGWECGMSGAVSAVRGIARWCWEERVMAVELVGWWSAEAPPLEIGGEAPLEVDTEALLELEGDWERVGGDLGGLWFMSRFGIGCGVGGWRLVGHL